MNKEERFEIKVNQEDVQNIINCYEKDIEYIKNLEQENKELQEELQKADSITQSCIFNGKKESGLNFRQSLNLVKELRKENKELHSKIGKAIEYIKKYQQIYDIDGSIEKQIDEFNILASPKRLLEILKDSDVDE